MNKLKYIFFVASIWMVQSCNIDDIPNPNGSSAEAILVNATQSQLQTLVTGSEDLLRDEIGFYYDVAAILGREYYFFTGSDPRYTGELLGREDSQLDNAGFYGTRPYFGRYKTIRNLNVLIEAATASNSITAEQLNGYLGFAQTFQAYELHIAANLQFQNGIRTDVADIDNLGPFLSYDESLTEIIELLDAGAANLAAAGGAFPFSLSSAMAGFDTPASFTSFNRALSARIALYQGNNADAVSRLGGSFMDMNASLATGPARFYSSAGGDLANNVFRVTDQADAIIAHPSFLSDADPADSRLSKVLLRPSGTLTLDDLSGDYDVVVFNSLDSPIPYINNEELILIWAEANIGTDNDGVVNAINLIRSSAGLAGYSGGTSNADLLTEVLYQRRYSLFGLGHRWVDARRTNTLSTLPIDRVGDDVWVQMPRPVSETE